MWKTYSLKDHLEVTFRATHRSVVHNAFECKYAYSLEALYILKILRHTFSTLVQKCTWSLFYTVLCKQKMILEMENPFIKICGIDRNSLQEENLHKCHPLLSCYPAEAVVPDRDGLANGV